MVRKRPSSDTSGGASPASSPNTYLKRCRECDQLVRMVEGTDGTWTPLEPDVRPVRAAAGEEHDCATVPKIRQGWTLQELGHPLTYRLECWWCGDTAFLHTNGAGSFALFETLGWPWPAHSCWHAHRAEQDRALLQTETDLRARGYQGRGHLIGVVPSAVPDAMPTQARRDPPALQIRLSGTDHQIVDGAVEQIIRFVSAHHHRTPVALPLPVGKSEMLAEEEPTEEEDEADDVPFTQHHHHRAIEVWEAGPNLVARLAQLQLPEAVEVSIRQSRRH